MIPTIGSREALGRRHCLQLLAGGGLGMAAASSGGLAGRALAQAPGLEDAFVFMFTGGLNQQIVERSIFPAFQQKTGVKNLTFVGGEVTENVAKIRAQGANPISDVIYMSGPGAPQARAQGVLQPIDVSRVPNLAKSSIPLSPDKTLVPFSTTNACLIYNTKLFAEKGFAPPTSWQDLWDPKYKGHVGSYSLSAGGVGVSLIIAAAILAGEPGNLDAGLNKLVTLRPNMLDFFATGGVYETSFNQGDVWIGLNSTTRALQMRNEGWSVANVIPKEGAIAIPGYLGLVKNAPHPNAGHAWIDFMLGTEAQGIVMRRLGLSPVNMDVPISDDDRHFHPSKEHVIVPDWEAISPRMPEIVRQWNRRVER